jgi:tRNA(Ile2) C34 agmatinyltransferase TiaS
MTMKRMGMTEVSVGKALTVKVETVTLVKVERISHTSCIKCKKLIKSKGKVTLKQAYVA